MPKHLPIPGRWLEKVATAGADECWTWTGSTDQDGYGKFQHPGVNGRQVHTRAHRWAFEHFVGPIPDGHVVMHRCNNPSCVNPAHLDHGLPTDNNNNDKVQKDQHVKRWGLARIRAEQTHCINGHPLSGRNLWVNPKTGHRRCRQCAADRAREAYRRQRG